jgi:hypothetical protein
LLGKLKSAFCLIDEALIETKRNQDHLWFASALETKAAIMIVNQG